MISADCAINDLTHQNDHKKYPLHEPHKSWDLLQFAPLLQFLFQIIDPVNQNNGIIHNVTREHNHADEHRLAERLSRDEQCEPDADACKRNRRHDHERLAVGLEEAREHHVNQYDRNHERDQKLWSAF